MNASKKQETFQFHNSNLESLRPFFYYYGGKARAAKKYPAPKYETIIEPFAGAAGYSTMYYDRNVILYDIDEKICGVWEYLIGSSERDILSLPMVEPNGNVNDLNICQEAKWLIGFLLNAGSNAPANVPSKWMISVLTGQPKTITFWTPERRELTAKQSQFIKHWKIINSSYHDIDISKPATWFIDPPYSGRAGRIYKHNKIDYNNLSIWCKKTTGQSIVCEQYGADWLDFESIGEILVSTNRLCKKKSHEAIWYNET